MNPKDRAVLNAEGDLIGYVRRNASSVGASKLTGVSMKLARQESGAYAWVPA